MWIRMPDEKKDSIREEYVRYCMVCSKCNANGPVIQVNARMLNDSNDMDYVKAYIENIFETRRQWDGLEKASC